MLKHPLVTSPGLPQQPRPTFGDFQGSQREREGEGSSCIVRYRPHIIDVPPVPQSSRRAITVAF